MSAEVQNDPTAAHMIESLTAKDDQAITISGTAVPLDRRQTTTVEDLKRCRKIHVARIVKETRHLRLLVASSSPMTNQ